MRTLDGSPAEGALVSTGSGSVRTDDKGVFVLDLTPFMPAIG